MNILIVVAHEKKNSLTHHLVNRIINLINTQKHTLDVLNLYDYADDIPYYTHDRTQLEQNAFFQLNKKKVMAADRLIIVFPMYWYSTPGILKAWFDLITNYAWQFHKPTQAKARHAIKKALIISSSIQPWWYSLIFGNLALKQVARTLKWMGVKKVMVYELVQVNQLNEKKLNTHLNRIRTRVTALLS